MHSATETSVRALQCTVLQRARIARSRGWPWPGLQLPEMQKTHIGHRGFSSFGNHTMRLQSSSLTPLLATMGCSALPPRQFTSDSLIKVLTDDERNSISSSASSHLVSAELEPIVASPTVTSVPDANFDQVVANAFAYWKKCSPSDLQTKMSVTPYASTGASRQANVRRTRLFATGVELPSSSTELSPKGNIQQHTVHLVNFQSLVQWSLRRCRHHQMSSAAAPHQCIWAVRNLMHRRHRIRPPVKPRERLD